MNCTYFKSDMYYVRVGNCPVFCSVLKTCSIVNSKNVTNIGLDDKGHMP